MWRLRINARCLCVPIRKIVRSISSPVLPCRRTTLRFFACTSPPSDNFSTTPVEVSDSNICWYLSFENFVWLTFTRSASQVNLIQKRRRFPKLEFFSSALSTCYRECKQTGSPRPVLSHIRSQSGPSRTASLKAIQPPWHPHKFLSRRITDSQIFANFSAIGVVVIESRCRDIQNSEVSARLERPHF